MIRPFSLFVGLRYTRAKRRNRFFSVISLISVIGFMLSVAVLIIVLSVMNGFEKELRQRILGMIPHANIVGFEPIANWQHLMEMVLQDKDVVGAAPFVELQGMLTARGQVQGILVNGIEPTLENKISIINQHMLEGRLEDLKSGEFGIILGKTLAQRLGVGLGDKITLVLPEAAITPGGIYPRIKRLTLVGIYKVGAEVDSGLAFVHLDDAAVLGKLQGRVDGLRLKVDNLFKAGEVANRITHQLSDEFYATDWTRSQGNLFNAIQLEKNMIGLLLSLIVLVAAFNIVSTLVMLVTDKAADIAILRTLGASPFEIMKIFVIQGSVIGFSGIVVGVILGVLGALFATDIIEWIEAIRGQQFLSSDIYFIDYIPSDLRWHDVVTICMGAMIASFLSTLYPAWRASRVQPAEALRYE